MKYKVIGFVIQWLIDGNWDRVFHKSISKPSVIKRFLELQSKYPNEKFRIVDIRINEKFLEKEVLI